MKELMGAIPAWQRAYNALHPSYPIQIDRDIACRWLGIFLLLATFKVPTSRLFNGEKPKFGVAKALSMRHFYCLTTSFDLRFF